MFHTDNKKVGNSVRRNKILVVNVANPLSHGGAAIAISLVKSLNTVIPKAEVSFMATRTLMFLYIRKIWV